MAIPSGTGTEVLHRVTRHANSGWNAVGMPAAANHIYTILSIIFCDQNGAAGTIQIKVNDGSQDLHLLASHAHVAYETFVWNDKFVIEEDDVLSVYSSGNNTDWYVSYVDQDWS